MPAIALFKTSVSSIKSHFKWKCTNTGAEMSRSLSLSKAFLYTALKLKGWSFLVRQLKSWGILL